MLPPLHKWKDQRTLPPLASSLRHLVLAIKELVEAYTSAEGELVPVEPVLHAANDMGSKHGLLRFSDGVDKLLLLFGTLGSIGDGLMNPVMMLVLSRLIDEYEGVGFALSNDVVDKYSLRLLFVAIAGGMSAFIEGICWTRTAERQSYSMRKEYLKAVLRQEVGFFDNKDATSTTFQVVSTISSDAHFIQDTIAEKIPNCLAQITSFIFNIVVAFLLSWRLALAALPFCLMFIIPGVGFGKVVKDLGSKMKDAYGIAGGIAEQAISSIRTVYSYVGERQTLDRFGDALHRSMKVGIKQGFTKGLLIGSMGMIYVVCAFQAWVGSILVIEKGEKGGAVFICGVSLILGGVSVMKALPDLSSILEATTAATQILEMTERIPTIDSEEEKGKILTIVRGEIEFKEVYFSYPSRPDTPILQGLNLKVRAGKTVGLVGGSGSGKSTVISLLERFYDPVKGDILLDKHNIKRLQLKWLRSQMGLVNQEPILFNTSIKENILFGKEEASMDLVVRAAKAANAHDFIVKLPQGYESQVGQFGVQFSGGQKQRIAIARALIRDPRILLLDEATSALDAGSERIVQEALDEASEGRTTIIVAHRLSTILRADLIVVLQSGRVVESGSHDELMRMNNGEGGAYHKMVHLQQSGMQNEASYSPHYRREEISSRSPRTPVSVRSSRQSSPAYPFSSVFSFDLTHTFEVQPHNNLNGEKLNNESHPSASVRRLLQMSAPEWKQALLGCLGAAGYGTIEPIYAYCLGTIISVYYATDNSTVKSETRFYCCIFLSLAVLSFIANLLQHYNFAIMGESLTKRVRQKMLDKLLTFEIGWFDEDDHTSAAICARLATEANMVRSLVADRMSLLVQVSFSACVAFAVGLVVTWRIASIMIAMQPLIIASFYSRSVMIKRLSGKVKKEQSQGSQLASEATVNHRTITAFSSQERLLSLFEAAMRGSRKEGIKQSWFSGVGLFCSQFLTTASLALTFWYGGRLVNQKLVNPKHLFQAFFLLISTGKSIADAGTMTSDIAKSGSAIGSVFAIIDRQSEIEPEDSNGIKVKKSIAGSIELKKVFFAYPARPNNMIFKGLSLKIEAGKTMALVGQSGSGKSTIIGLVERFYDPLKGTLLIDKHDIKSYNLRKLRSYIALVSQEPTLFAGTIRENIVFGKDNAAESEVRKAARLANAHEFISSMNDGYDTYCGERGVQLSGGQKQRIALARAILKDPAILLLDEATSALDSVSENLVQEALEKMMVGRTCVVVAHRLSTIQKADSIAVISDGKVAEIGSHYDLLAMGPHGAYYSLIKLQNNHSNHT